MAKRTFHRYCDPGHSWIKVSKFLLDSLGIANQISSYSYLRGDFAYLEEDCDAPLLINTMHRGGFLVTIKSHYTNRQSKVRSYDCYEI